jgi:hypothetical protein
VLFVKMSHPVFDSIAALGNCSAAIDCGGQLPAPREMPTATIRDCAQFQRTAIRSRLFSASR